MNTEDYCQTPEMMCPVMAVRAVHEAYLQLAAIQKEGCAPQFDNRPAMRSCAEVLRDAGHPGFQDPANPTP